MKSLMLFLLSVGSVLAQDRPVQLDFPRGQSVVLDPNAPIDARVRMLERAAILHHHWLQGTLGQWGEHPGPNGPGNPNPLPIPTGPLKRVEFYTQSYGCTGNWAAYAELDVARGGMLAQCTAVKPAETMKITSISIDGNCSLYRDPLDFVPACVGVPLTGAPKNTVPAVAEQVVFYQSESCAESSNKYTVSMIPEANQYQGYCESVVKEAGYRTGGGNGYYLYAVKIGGACRDIPNTTDMVEACKNVKR